MSDWVAALGPFEAAAEVAPFPAKVQLTALKQAEALSMHSLGETRTSFPECSQGVCAQIIHSEKEVLQIGQGLWARGAGSCSQ